LGSGWWMWMGLTGDEKALAGACAISLIRGRAVVVGVRENADFPLAQYYGIRGRAVVVGVRENAEFPKKMSKKCMLNAKVYVLIPTLNIAFTVLKICIYGYLPIYIFR